MHQQSNHYRFRVWLVAWSGLSHYLNQCWITINWTIKNNFSEISKRKRFDWRKCIWKCRLQNGAHFVTASVDTHHNVYGWPTASKISPTWWRHQMGTFSALLAICAGNSSVPGELPTKRPVTRSFDVLSWINDWVNNGKAGDLRRHHAHYDVTAMKNAGPPYWHVLTAIRALLYLHRWFRVVCFVSLS